LLLYRLAMSRFPCVFYRRRSSKKRILLDAIGDALEDVLYHRTMVALRLVIAKAHHAPMFADGVPAHFDDAVVDLFAIGLQTLPLLVTHVHCVPGLIIGFRPLAPTPNVKREDGLREQVRLGW